MWLFLNLFLLESEIQEETIWLCKSWNNPWAKFSSDMIIQMRKRFFKQFWYPFLNWLGQRQDQYSRRSRSYSTQSNCSEIPFLLCTFSLYYICATHAKSKRWQNLLRQITLHVGSRIFQFLLKFWHWNLTSRDKSVMHCCPDT